MSTDIKQLHAGLELVYAQIFTTKIFSCRGVQAKAAAKDRVAAAPELWQAGAWDGRYRVTQL